MFIGHFALGLAAKRAAPRVSLVILFVAVQLADLLWPLLVMTGVEQVRLDPGATAFTPLDFISYPYSHSLLSLVVLGLVLGYAYRQVTGNRGAVLLLASLVVSHWVLDVVTHRPDVPLYPGGPRLGLGLWNSIPATLAVEIPIFAAGLWLYLLSTTARGAVGRWGFAGLMVCLVAVYLGSIGNPPPSLPALYLSAIAGSAVILGWTWWIDGHRSMKPLRSSGS